MRLFIKNTVSGWAVLLLLFVSGPVQGQELNARVEILAPQVPNANKRVMDVLQKIATDFLNNRSWTGRKVTPNERIDCNFVITIHSWDGASEYTAQSQIVSMRPVYETTYDSPVLNMMDKNFDFSYVEGQIMEFSEQQFMNNFTSLLAFYAYVIIGMDADTFAPNGGNFYFQKASGIVNNAQQGGFKGWRSFDGNESRYWLSANLLDAKFDLLRNFVYRYYRQGLDQLSSNQSAAHESLKVMLPDLKKLDRFGQGSMLDQLFFTAKAGELAGIYSNLNHQERMNAYQILMEIDPANSNKYEEMRNR